MHPGHAAIVYNPVTVPLDRVRAAVRAEEVRNGWEPSRWYPTDAEDSGSQAARNALAEHPSVLIVAGGDGTVRAVAERVQAGGIPLALLPYGTGNLLARNLALPLSDVVASVRTAFTGSTTNVDVAVAELEDVEGTRTTHTFMVMAGIGLDAAMAENTNAIAKRHLGWLAYVAPIARSILANRHFPLRYRVDDDHVKAARAHTVIVGNCGTLTGNMLLLPAAKLDDGLLDVVMLRPQSRFGWARIGTRLTVQGIAQRSRFGRRMLLLAPGLEALAYAQGHRFEIRFDLPHTVELDGDGFGEIVGGRITVRPGALGVRVPRRGSDAALDV